MRCDTLRGNTMQGNMIQWKYNAIRYNTERSSKVRYIVNRNDEVTGLGAIIRSILWIETRLTGVDGIVISIPWIETRSKVDRMANCRVIERGDVTHTPHWGTLIQLTQQRFYSALSPHTHMYLTCWRFHSYASLRHSHTAQTLMILLRTITQAPTTAYTAAILLSTITTHSHIPYIPTMLPIRPTQVLSYSSHNSDSTQHYHHTLTYTLHADDFTHSPHLGTHIHE